MSENGRPRYYIPTRDDFPVDFAKLRIWYANLLLETSETCCLRDDQLLLRDKRNYYGKYLTEGSRTFFLQHFARNLADAVNFLCGSRPNGLRFLELGCGCGNQLLLMALAGARVVGCDIRQDVCALVRKRTAFYEQLSGRKLDLTIICQDAFQVDWDAQGKFDALNFLFSFNDLPPSDKALDLTAKLLKPGGRVAFQETNQSNYYNRLLRRRDSMGPMQMVEALKRRGFRIHALRGGYALPHLAWRFLPESLLRPLDDLLRRSLFLSPSYQLLAEKI